MNDIGGYCLSPHEGMDTFICIVVSGITAGLWTAIEGIVAMDVCHKLCNLAQKKGASGYTGNEWWYADQTAYNACLKQNPKVLKNWGAGWIIESKKKK